jgi:hypothetical protein
VLLGGVNQLMRTVSPGLPGATRMLVLGALTCTSAARWGFYYLQGAPLVFGLLCLYVVALHRNRALLAFSVATLVVCLKFTLGLPFVGLALVQRRYALLAGVAAIFMLVNVIGFQRMGGMSAVAGYQANMARFEQPDQLNYPDFRAPSSMQRLDWPYLLNAISPDIARSATLGALLSAASVLWLAWQAWRARAFARELGTTLAFLGPLVCLSLLSVYHHHYDAIALFGAAIVYLFGPGKQDRRLIALFVVPVFVFAGVYPVAQVQDVLGGLFGAGSAAVAKLLGVASVTLAFAASLVLLGDFVRRRSTADADRLDRTISHESGRALPERQARYQAAS